MRVKELMTTRAATCRASDDLQAAARQMAESDCGSLPVIAPDGKVERVVGMITDRDICMAAMREEKALKKIKVSDAMTAEIFSCAADDEVEKAQEIMRSAQVRRIPVVDANGGMQGMLSLAQVARAAEEGKLAAGDVGKTLGSICQPTAESHA